MLVFLFRLLFLTSIPGLLSASESGAVILQYHHVHDSTPPVTSIAIDQFREHLDYLLENKFLVWPLETLVSAIRDKEEIPDRVVSITFDDAYDDLYDNALPLLLERDLPFTVFVSTELVGKHHYLTWAELKEMQKKGATIANHTHSHTHLLRKQKNESDAQWRTRVTDEIEQAQYLLDKHLDNIPRYLAYPYGEYSMQLLKIVSDLQFVGFGQQSGAAGSYSSMLLIPRFPVSGVYSHLNSLSTKLLTKPMPTITPVLDPLRQVQIPELRLEFPSVVPGLSQLACYGPGGRTQLVKLSDTEYVAKSSEPIPIGRSRYNCTMPSGETGRFYWYSQLWIRKNEDGSWYLEP